LGSQVKSFQVLKLHLLRDLTGLLVEFSRFLNLPVARSNITVPAIDIHFQVGLVMEKSFLFFHPGHVPRFHASSYVHEKIREARGGLR
jgi:hypothetical protein